MPDSIKATSSNKFDGESTAELLNEKPIELISKKIPSEQYDSFFYAELDSDGYDGFDEIYNKISKNIGICMVMFSELEVAIEHNLHEMISERSHQLGRMITREMSYIQKVNLYIDHLRGYPVADDVDTDSYLKDVASMKKHLYRAGEIRNIIAHAKWPSVTSDGYVLSSVETMVNSQSGPEYRYYQLNEAALDSARAYIGAVGNFPFRINETYIER